VKLSANTQEGGSPTVLRGRSSFPRTIRLKCCAVSLALKESMKAETNIPPHDKGRHRFSSDYKNLRLSVELLPCGGWFAGVYDMEAEGWLWTEYVSDAEGKTLISHAKRINAEDVLWYRYQPLPTRSN